MKPETLQDSHIERCVECGESIVSQYAVHNRRGYLICDSCVSSVAARKSLSRTLHGFVASSVIAGIYSVIYSSFALSIVGIVLGVAGLVMLHRPENRGHLGARRSWHLAGTLIGIALSCVSLILSATHG